MKEQLINFEPRQLERNFEPIEWNQNRSHQGEINSQPGPSPVACNTTPNPPPGCPNHVPGVNIDIYAPMLMLIAILVGLMKLQKFKLKRGI